MNFNDLTGSIEDIATTIAIVGGGAWTMYTFSALGTRAKAQAEMFKQAVLDVTIDAKCEVHNGGRIIAAVAIVTNKGTRNTFLDFRERAPFRLSRIVFRADGVGEYDLFAEVDADTAYMTLRTGAAGRFPLFFVVREPGLYLIEFSVALTSDEMVVHEETARGARRSVARAHGGADGDERSIVWRGSTHITVA